MNLSSKRGLFPWFTLLAGAVGLALRSWLVSTADDRGLLPENHFAGIASFLLLAFVLAVCFLAVRKAPKTAPYRKLFPPSLLAAAGTALGAAGMAFSAFTSQSTGFFQLILLILGIVGAGALVITAYCRMKGLRPNCLLHGLFAVYLIVRVLVCCRDWGSEPEVQRFFFQLLSCLFLLMACYYRAELDVRAGDCRRYVFFSQAALFCCCLSLTGSDWLFYLSAVIWVAADYCVLPVAEPEE